VKFGSLNRTFPPIRGLGLTSRLLTVAFAVAAAALLSPKLLSGQTPSPTLILRIIVVDSPSEAKQILDRLRDGADFAVLAKEKSTDASANDGGYIGKVDPTTLRPELWDSLTHRTGTSHRSRKNPFRLCNSESLAFKRISGT
jgi:hypothetical protein